MILYESRQRFGSIVQKIRQVSNFTQFTMTDQEIQINHSIAVTV